MKKKLSALLLLLALLCSLCACGKTEPADVQTEHVGEATAAEPDDEKTGETPADGEAAPTETEETPPSVPEAADGLFFSCRNMHYVFLQELEGALIEFYILSEEALSPEEILIDTGLEAQSRTEIREIKLAGYGDPENVNAAVDALTVPNEVLLCGQIGDWERICELEARYAASETKDERVECLDALSAITGSAWSAASGNTREDRSAPAFCAYQATVYLSNRTGKIETTQSITIRIKDRSYEVDCGSVTVDSLHTLGELDHSNSEVLMDVKFALSLGVEPCSGGWITSSFSSLFGFLAMDNVTLTGLSLYEADAEAYELRSIVLSVTDVEGMTTQFEWDGSSPILLKANSTADFFLVLYDPRADSLLYRANPHVVLSYRQMKGANYSKICTVPVTIEGDPYVLHAQYAEGLNLEAYYRTISKMLYSMDNIHRLNYGFDRP